MTRKKKISGRFRLLSNCWFMLRIAFSVNRKLFFIKIPVILLTTFYPFLSVYFFKNILNEITTGGAWEKVFVNVVVMASVILAAELLIGGFTLMENKWTEQTVHLMKLHLGTAIMKIPYEELEKPEMKDLISLAQNGNTFLQIINNVTLLVSGVIKTVGLFSLVVTVHPFILLVVVLIFILQIFIEKRNQSLWPKWRSLLAPIRRKGDYYAKTMKELAFGKEMRVNNLKDYIIEKYENQEMHVYIPTEMKRLRTIQNRYFPSNFSVMLQEGIAYLFLAYKVVFQNMLIGDFTFYLSIVGGFSEGIRAVKGSYWLLGRNGAFAEEFRRCIELSKQEDEYANGQAVIQDQGNITIEFINVSFQYPNTDRMILKNISFTLRPGETLSIVGINGAGKTTLVKLLCRLYAPTSGEIRINHIPIQKIKFSEYTKLIGAVFQDFKLFSFSVRENIVMEDTEDTPRLHACIDKSGLKDKIASLPRGLDTMVYKEFDESGIEFSGGESQKLALARALYKDAAVIILDEPTAALDPIAEYDIYRRFQELTKNKSAIYISHRLSSTRFTDNIAVFSQGELVEYGKHAQLMQIENGIYKNMFDMQAQNYKF